MKMKSLLLKVALLVICFGFAELPVPVRAASAPAAKPAVQGDFFIISSVNRRSHELFLKAPTEVTELMTVSDQTTLLDAQGKKLDFTQLRAGDTVYVVSRKNGNGLPLAVRIQKGPMTRAILHQRYIAFR
ncbi:MAG TPA: hypothetical protein VFZ08_09520 [Terriglobia bacterium]|nr:hypothetical protein [Terriglobia bacterium]